MDTLPKGYRRATLRRRLDLTDDLALFFLDGERGDFRPGQYVTLALEAEERRVKRAYSIASAPHEPGLELFVELVEEGALTPTLWDLAEGDTLLMREKIVGHFVLDERRTTHAMACTVTGIAPFLSMLRAYRQSGASGHRFLVVHGASTSPEFGPYRDELAVLAEAHDWLTYVPTISRPWTDVDWTGEVGRVEDVLRKHLDAFGCDPAETAGYACGHPQMIENVKGIFGRVRLAADQIHEEKYFTESEPAKPAAAPAAAPQAELAEPTAKRPGEIRLKAVKRPSA